MNEAVVAAAPLRAGALAGARDARDGVRERHLGALVAAAQTAPRRPHRLLADVVEEEDEEALRRVEDAEDVLEGEAGVTHGEEADHPRQTCLVQEM